MRTTLRLDDDLFLALQRLAAAKGVTLSVAVNGVVRAGLAAERPRRRPFRQPTVDLGAPSVDLTRANEAAAALDDAALLRRTREP